ncbi:Epsin-3, clathrin recruitment and traffic between the Golgi and endosome [Hypocenomyce scalaris]|nr:Epsin-3, clathrin recruitment and traffic between the Golgi and endosome [Hypocenomyce scalaris]
MNFDSLKDQVSNLTLYDLKAGVRKVQNVVMNYTEMEAKVQALSQSSRSILIKLARFGKLRIMSRGGHRRHSCRKSPVAHTASHQLLNEIMPMIYKRFTEKAAEEWRQIYKGLQLLEFLIKNGSERVIDDARSHLSLLKMLRQFHFIDQNGKDQGVNVRNRAKELAELLSDVDRIRTERKKARANRNKFGGVEGGAISGGMSSGSRYGGFGNEEAGAGYGGYSGGVYGDGGGFGGNTGGFQDTGAGGRRDRFDEYDEYDEGASPATARRKTEPSTTTSIPSSGRGEARKPEAPKKKEPEIDLLDTLGDDDIPPKTPPKPAFPNGKKAATNAMVDLQPSGTEDDEFDEFISATPTTQVSSNPSIPGMPPPSSSASIASSIQFAAPKPVSASKGANMNNLVGGGGGFPSISPAPMSDTMISPPLNSFSSPQLTPLAPQYQHQQAPRPTGYQAAQPNYFTSVTAASPSSQTPTGTPSARPSFASSASFGKPAAATNTTKSSSAASGGDVFGSLWSTASAGAGIKKTTTPGSQGPNLASMAKEKASAGIWGATAAPAPPVGQGARPVQSEGQSFGGGLDDLLG